MKIQRQLSASVIIPPKTGLKATAQAVIIVPIPIIKPSFSLGTSAKIILYINGKPIPVPTPCIARPNNNKSKRGDKISMISPKVNKRTPRIKIFLVEILNLICELIGTIVAITNKTSVFTHWTWSVVIENSLINVGKVTVVAVSSNIPKNESIPADKIANTKRGVTF